MLKISLLACYVSCPFVSSEDLLYVTHNTIQPRFFLVIWSMHHLSKDFVVLCRTLHASSLQYPSRYKSRAAGSNSLVVWQGQYHSVSLYPVISYTKTILAMLKCLVIYEDNVRGHFQTILADLNITMMFWGRGGWVVTLLLTTSNQHAPACPWVQFLRARVVQCNYKTIGNQQEQYPVL